MFSVLGYFVTNWGFMLARDARGRTFHVRRGLLTSTETSLERERVRGLEVGEPLGLRLAGAGRLDADRHGCLEERGRPHPAGAARAAHESSTRAGARCSTTPSRCGCRWCSTVRRPDAAARPAPWSGAAVLPVAALVVPPRPPVPWWAVLPALLAVPVGRVLAADRYRRLGPRPDRGLPRRPLRALRGRRDMLQRTGIIGWNIQQSWFQRRAGLVTLVATTAAGAPGVRRHRHPRGQAIALADAAVPGLVEPFLV